MAGTESTQHPPAGRKRRFRLRWSLRALLLVVALLAVAAAWFGSEVRRAARQRAAVERLQQRGALVSYDYLATESLQSPTPKWLQRWFGEDLFVHVDSVQAFGIDDPRGVLNDLRDLDHVQELDLRFTDLAEGDLAGLRHLTSVTALSLNGTDLRRCDLEELRHLPKLTSLELQHAKLSDEAKRTVGTLKQLTHLDLSAANIDADDTFVFSELRKLEVLHLWRTSVDDRSLAALRQHDRLFLLSLAGTRVTGPGLVHLEGLRGLRKLSLAGSRVSDSQAHHLRNIPKGVTLLNLNYTAISDASLQYIDHLTALEQLYLWDTPVQGPGLADLKPCTKLAVLLLQGADIDDAAVEHLRKLHSLQEVYVSRGALSAAALQELRDALPQCDVVVE